MMYVYRQGMGMREKGPWLVDPGPLSPDTGATVYVAPGDVERDARQLQAGSTRHAGNA
jgi:hypothetical protein